MSSVISRLASLEQASCGQGRVLPSVAHTENRNYPVKLADIDEFGNCISRVNKTYRHPTVSFFGVFHKH